MVGLEPFSTSSTEYLQLSVDLLDSRHGIWWKLLCGLILKDFLVREFLKVFFFYHFIGIICWRQKFYIAFDLLVQLFLSLKKLIKTCNILLTKLLNAFLNDVYVLRRWWLFQLLDIASNEVDRPEDAILLNLQIKLQLLHVLFEVSQLKLFGRLVKKGHHLGWNQLLTKHLVVLSILCYELLFLIHKKYNASMGNRTPIHGLKIRCPGRWTIKAYIHHTPCVCIRPWIFLT